MERAFVRCTVTEETERDPVYTLKLAGERRARRDGQSGPHDACFTNAADAEIGQMHRPALTLADTCLATEEFGHQRVELRALGNRVSVRTMIAHHVIVGAQCHAGADDFAFLTDGRMQRTNDQPFGVHLFGELFKSPNADHATIHFLADTVFDRHALGILIPYSLRPARVPQLHPSRFRKDIHRFPERHICRVVQGSRSLRIGENLDADEPSITRRSNRAQKRGHVEIAFAR